MTHHFCDRCGKRVMSRKDLSEVTIVEKEKEKLRDGNPVKPLAEICNGCVDLVKNLLRPTNDAQT
jgi:hypothetical protein